MYSSFKWSCLYKPALIYLSLTGNAVYSTASASCWISAGCVKIMMSLKKLIVLYMDTFKSSKYDLFGLALARWVTNHTGKRVTFIKNEVNMPPPGMMQPHTQVSWSRFQHFRMLFLREYYELNESKALPTASVPYTTENNCKFFDSSWLTMNVYGASIRQMLSTDLNFYLTWKINLMLTIFD